MCSALGQDVILDLALYKFGIFILFIYLDHDIFTRHKHEFFSEFQEAILNRKKYCAHKRSSIWQIFSAALFTGLSVTDTYCIS